MGYQGEDGENRSPATSNQRGMMGAFVLWQRLRRPLPTSIKCYCHSKGNNTPRPAGKYKGRVKPRSVCGEQTPPPWPAFCGTSRDRVLTTQSLQKGVHMWHVIAQSGLASTGVDFTESLSLLGAGLVGVVWLSAGLIVFLALQHYWSQTRTRLPETTPGPLDHQEAA